MDLERSPKSRMRKGKAIAMDNQRNNEAIQLLMEISELLGTGLTEEQLVLAVRLIENGTNPQALANVIRILQRESSALNEH